MTTMKEHLAGMHARHQEHHELKAKIHKKMAGHFETLGKHFQKTTATEAERDAAATLAALSSEHESLWQEHSDLAAYHQEQLKACEKAADSDLNKLVPTSVSAVAPNRPGLTMVPRAGEQPVPARPAVPEQFAHLVKVEDGEDAPGVM
jgi:hypothetical protein